MRDHSEPVLDGEGETDYARYMRTDALLALQRPPEVRVHRDELLFQVVHQSTELWLKLACAEVAEAAALLGRDRLDEAARLLARAALSVRLCTDQLDMMRCLSPWDFQTIRTVLGRGSGLQSPGWRSVRAVSAELAAVFEAFLREQAIDLAEAYRAGMDSAICRLAESMIEWDERVCVWRIEHVKMATRVIGHGVTGTRGTPVDSLARLVGHRLFPELWRVRTRLTESSGSSRADEPRRAPA